ncbi:MAG: aspartate--tRNA ligase [Nitrospinae bacterium]|nr:aspartate--tRNA ligase [Nitrospinota bacterium]
MEQLRRTHNCGELRETNLDETVTVMGWVDSRRDHGGVIFIDLRDRWGITQVVFNPDINKETHERAHTLRSEFVIAAQGKVTARSEETINEKLPTGKVEVYCNTLQILNKSDVLPFQLDDTDITENNRLKHRYLDLRRKEMQEGIILRHKAAKTIRDYLDAHSFLEIETPILNKSTPEGARDYLVPSRVNEGMFYALPQSPQIFKQLLMVSGYERYFQIVKCFRDEDLRADRQPEFTQIDIEISFTNANEVMEITEGLMKNIVKTVDGRDIEGNFKRISWHEAMNKYGCDKPDLRFDLEIKDLTEIAGNSDFKIFNSIAKSGGIIKAINAKQAEFSRKDLDDLTNELAVYGAKGMAWIKVTEEGLQSPIIKFFSQETLDQMMEVMEAKPGDYILFGAGKPSIVHASLAYLRLAVGKRLNLIDENALNFLWVTDFPMFEKDEENGKLKSLHHPFTKPLCTDLKDLTEKPEEVISDAYDLVLNGCEIGGGSIRIHNVEMQKEVFKALKIGDEEAQEKFGFLLEALRFGAPPHGGLALGFDRILMMLLKKESIRDVIAFPKTQKASCLMSEAPSRVDKKQLIELSLKSLANLDNE